MAVVLRIPAHLRPSAGGVDQLWLEGTTLGELLQNLESAHPQLRSQLLDGDGRPRRCLRLFVNDQDSARSNGMDTPLRHGDEVTVLLALAGG